MNPARGKWTTTSPTHGSLRAIEMLSADSPTSSPLTGTLPVSSGVMLICRPDLRPLGSSAIDASCRGLGRLGDLKCFGRRVLALSVTERLHALRPGACPTARSTIRCGSFSSTWASRQVRSTDCPGLSSRAPAAASASAVARPMPRDAPVTSAILFASLVMGSSLSCLRDQFAVGLDQYRTSRRARLIGADSICHALEPSGLTTPSIALAAFKPPT